MCISSVLRPPTSQTWCRTTKPSEARSKSSFQHRAPSQVDNSAREQTTESPTQPWTCMQDFRSKVTVEPSLVNSSWSPPDHLPLRPLEQTSSSSIRLGWRPSSHSHERQLSPRWTCRRTSSPTGLFCRIRIFTPMQRTNSLPRMVWNSHNSSSHRGKSYSVQGASSNRSSSVKTREGSATSHSHQRREWPSTATTSTCIKLQFPPFRSKTNRKCIQLLWLSISTDWRWETSNLHAKRVHSAMARLLRFTKKVASSEPIQTAHHQRRMQLQMRTP